MSVRLGFAAALCITMVVGCNNKEEELQKQLSQIQGEQASTKQLLSERDKYVEDVMQSVNDVYKDLEQARMKEGRLLKRTGDVELSAQNANTDTRQKLLADIGDIGNVLKENRKRIAGLQVRMKKYNSQIAGLDSLVENLKLSIQEREQSIALLQSKVQGLEVTLNEKTKSLQEKEMVIDDQQRRLNTGFYIVGTRDELKKKGIILNEGGFLWGLLGSTTVMATEIDLTNFTPIDKTKDQTIHVQGKIEEILPSRKDNAYAMAQKDEGSSDITIVSPDKFWLSNYLVIVVD